MRWFRRAKQDGDKPPKTTRVKHPDPTPANSPPRRERYSGWNDPDLPTYGDPFDG